MPPGAGREVGAAWPGSRPQQGDSGLSVSMPTVTIAQLYQPCRGPLGSASSRWLDLKSTPPNYPFLSRFTVSHSSLWKCKLNTKLHTNSILLFPASQSSEKFPFRIGDTLDTLQLGNHCKHMQSWINLFYRTPTKIPVCYHSDFSTSCLHVWLKAPQ